MDHRAKQRVLASSPQLSLFRNLEPENDRELFRWASERVRSTVTEKVWLAFWLTSVDERLIPDVAAQLEMSVGSVYIARSRITKKIRYLVQQHEEPMT